MQLVLWVPVAILAFGIIAALIHQDWGDVGGGIIGAIVAAFVLFLFTALAGTFLSTQYELIESYPLAELNGAYTQPYYEEDGTLIVGYGYVAESGEVRLVEREFGDDLLVEVDPDVAEPRVEIYEDQKETWWALDVNNLIQHRLIVPEFPFEIRIPTGK